MTEQQNEDGSWSQAQPLGMTCEYKNCSCKDGQDYINHKPEKGWEGEPVFLCKEHAEELNYLPMPNKN